MKLKIKRPGSHVSKRDATRSKSITRSLVRFSVKKRRSDTDNYGKSPSKRDTITIQTPSARLSLSTPVNKNGNRTGMHNSENPPDPEHMRKIRAMRRIYNKQMPTLACSSCSFASSCPQFKAGYECAFNPFLNSHKVETTEDLLNYMKDLVASNMRRAQLASLMETLSGGAPSLELTESLAMIFNMARDLHEIESADGSELTIESEDDSIIRRLFGSTDNLLGETREALSKPIEVQAVVHSLNDIIHDGISGEETLNQEVSQELAKTELARTAKLDKGKSIQVSTLK